MGVLTGLGQGLGGLQPPLQANLGMLKASHAFHTRCTSSFLHLLCEECDAHRLHWAALVDTLLWFSPLQSKKWEQQNQQIGSFHLV